MKVPKVPYKVICNVSSVPKKDPKFPPLIVKGQKGKTYLLMSPKSVNVLVTKIAH